MELLAMKRDLPAIEDGRWVGAAEMPALGDLRVKVRGYASKHVQGQDQARKRALPPADLVNGKPNEAATERLGIALLQDVFCDIDGLTDGGKAMTADEVRPLLADPAFEPLSLLIMRAAMLVNESRVANAEAITKN
jgi:hypothetical protein